MNGTSAEQTPDLDWRDFRVDAMPPLLRSAVDTFVKHGYHGTSTRTLAAAAGMSVPGLYHHYPSKQTLIVAIMERAMAELRSRSQAALREAGSNPDRQLALHIECLALFHAHRKELALLAATEMRSLEPDARTRHLRARDTQELLLVTILRAGQVSGAFEPGNAAQMTRAMTTMCTGISQWFSPAGTLSAAEIAADYVDYAQRMVRRCNR